LRSARNENLSRTDAAWRRGSLRCLAVAGLALSASLGPFVGPLVGQAPTGSAPGAEALAEGQRLIRTPDGSRVLLHPTGGPGTIYWVVVSPAGPREDHEGHEGLAAAVVRASMSGTTRVGSRNRATENDLLARVDEHERRSAVLRRAGQVIPDDLLNELRQDASQAEAIADRLAWERSLRLAPAGGSRLSFLADAVLLHLAVPIESLSRVAGLLLVRREEPVLRGVHDELRAVRLELRNAAVAEPWTAVREELRALAYRAHPYARLGFDDPYAFAPLARAQALDTFRQTQRPDRVVHVLTGGFDPELVAQTLQRVFTATALTAEPLEAPKPIGVLRGARTSQVEPGKLAGVAIAYQPPPGADPDVVAVATKWLAGGEESFLARALFAKGLRCGLVRGTYPFPGAAAPLVLVEVGVDPQDAKDPARTRRLFSEVDAALDEAVRVRVAPEEIAVARGALLAERARQCASPDRLAAYLAIRWGVFGMSPAHAARSLDAVGEAVVLALLGQTLVRDRRVKVTQERAQ
jgi:predicted Zn-dependent peptidase